MTYMTGVRGCGKRVPGGIYAECGLSEDGKPVEDFLFCPPQPVDAKAAGVTPLGTKLVEHRGVWHVLDWVGAAHYPNPADFIEETRRLGVSRRLSPLLDYSLLTPESRILLMHERALAEDPTRLWRLLELAEETPRGCPRQVSEHYHADLSDLLLSVAYGDTPDARFPYCAAWHWETVRDGTPVSEGSRLVTREMPAFTYTAKRAPDGLNTEWRLGLFMWVPIGRLAVVRDAEGGTHNAAYDHAAGSSLPIDIVLE